MDEEDEKNREDIFLYLSIFHPIYPFILFILSLGFNKKLF